MSSNSIVTQCPSCNARFRVTPGQLKVAKGQVRCGACLTVFSANQQAKVTQPSETPRRKPNPKVKVAHTPVAEISKRHKKSPPSKQQTQSSATSAINESKAQKRKPEPDLIETLIKTAPTNDNEVPTLTIHAEAVTLSSPQNNQNKHSLKWFIACLLALLTLFGQHLWFNRAELYWNQNYQPLYSLICRDIDCHIPARIDTDKISSINFLVRPHSEIKDAISIDLILLNKAAFKQPFPALEISFSDLKGRLVASRVLQPETYLDLTQIDPKAMPINQPVQISLELMSPGIRGVSYELELLAPEL